MRRAVRLLRRARARRSFPGSEAYWEQRYAEGGNSGAGSYDKLATFKAEFLNAFVAERGIRSVIEWGSGDGAQTELFAFPTYLGLDVSGTVVASSRERFADIAEVTFSLVDDYAGTVFDLALSLDVIYHLVEDETFDRYMRDLFASSSRYVVVYSSNHEAQSTAPHVRHRMFTAWVAVHAPEWQLTETRLNPYPFEGDVSAGSFADFYVFERMGS